jgi:ketosteroid isomerase-like protein
MRAQWEHDERTRHGGNRGALGLDARPDQSALNAARSEKGQAMAETLIRQRVEDWAKALRAKEIDAVMSFYAPNIVSFDLDPPLRYAGTLSKRRAWQEFFAVHTGAISYEVRELDVATNSELAFVHSLNHVLPPHRWYVADDAQSRVCPSRP